ncbi:MAG: bifunctional chorismate mutase/prephenate dehydratase, partial [Ruminococcaceae bacterium]|nr:bifunctional chorismate mutase/prephenate dehydratase [Oscillospiraceae bacterium]
MRYDVLKNLIWETGTMSTNELQTCRQEISQIDQKMAELFVQRMRAVERIAEYKRERAMPIFDAEREKVLLEQGADRIEDEALRDYYSLYQQGVMQVAKLYQQRLLNGLRVAYSGTEGAFAHIAAKTFYPEAGHIPYPDFESAYNAVCSGDCDAVVLPLENSYAGEVGQVTDLIFSGPLFMNGTLDLAVTQDLLVLPGTRMEDITEVLSHPQALSQCRDYIRSHGWKETVFENTAMAAEFVAAAGKKTLAAIASSEAASLYGLEVLDRGINESSRNTTRFAVLSRSEDRNAASAHGAHFVLMFTVRNEAGSLARALNIVGAHGFNMRSLRSRPMKELLWQYYFYLEA